MPAAPTEKEVARIPLIGGYNTRTIDNSTNVVGGSGIIGLGIVGIFTIGLVSTSDKDQRFVNVMFEKVVNPATQKETYYACKRPGLDVNSAVSPGNVGNSVHVWASQGTGTKIISSFGSINSTIYDTGISQGSITGKTKFIDEASVGGTSNLLIASDDNTGWYLPDGGALTKISDADFPGNNSKTITGHFVAQDGYIFMMDTTGAIWNSDLNSQTSWSSTSFINAQMYPDKGVGLARYKNQIVAFGKASVEFFHIITNSTGSPLERTDNGFTRIGCASQNGYVQLEDTIAWISSTDLGGCSIYILDGFSPKRISTSPIESTLALMGPDTIKIAACKFQGKTLIFAIGAGLTYVHCLEDNTWTEWSSSTILWDEISTTNAGSWKIYTISKGSTDGKVYEINPQAFVYQDDGTNYTWMIQTSKIDFDTYKRKFFSRMNIICDQTDNASTFNISWSDDDYRTYRTARQVDLSTTNPYLTQLGSARRRAFRFSSTTNGPIRIEAIELEYTLGAH